MAGVASCPACSGQRACLTHWFLARMMADMDAEIFAALAEGYGGAQPESPTL